MPLPKLAVPEYECTLPVSGQKVEFRPFLVKEEKLLYLAMESQKEKEMIKKYQISSDRRTIKPMRQVAHGEWRRFKTERDLAG